jgi:hypothetical protein
MIIGPVPIGRMQPRELGTDRVIGSFACSHDRSADEARIRRAAERRGFAIVGEIATERW